MDDWNDVCMENWQSTAWQYNWIIVEVTLKLKLKQESAILLKLMTCGKSNGEEEHAL